MRVLNHSFDPAYPLDKLQAHPDNPRHGDIGAIHGSIEENGFWGGLIVQLSTGFILAGNHRFQAAAHAGAENVPVHFVDVDDATARKILAADNGISDRATNDDLKLIELLTRIRNEEGALDGTGYDDDDLQRLIDDEKRGMLLDGSPNAPTGTKSAPPAEKLPPGPGGDDEGPKAVEGRYKEQYAVIVVCENELHQREVFDHLQVEGYNVKVVVT